MVKPGTFQSTKILSIHPPCTGSWFSTKRHYSSEDKSLVHYLLEIPHEVKRHGKIMRQVLMEIAAWLGARGAPLLKAWPSFPHPLFPTPSSLLCSPTPYSLFLAPLYEVFSLAV